MRYHNIGDFERDAGCTKGSLLPSVLIAAAIAVAGAAYLLW